MRKLIGFLFIVLIIACAKNEQVVDPLEEQALAMASLKCRNPNSLEWLRQIIRLSEMDLEFKGSIYAIQYSSGTIFLHQPWISSCFACNLYSCSGDSVTLSEGERNEIIAGANEKNIIYTSSH
jgi:hypothetical protein